MGFPAHPPDHQAAGKPRTRLSGYRLAHGLIVLAGAVFLSSQAVSRPAAQSPTRPGAANETGPKAVVDRYCAGCHSERGKAGGLSLQNRDLASIGSDREVWEKVVRRVGAGSMPPVGAPRPDAPVLSSMVTALENALDRDAAAHPNPGRSGLRRLNRVEYANAIRDLLDLEVDVAGLLPPDEIRFGFDNIGDALSVPPALLERYLTAADTISALAVGDPQIPARTDTFVARADSHQLEHVEGLPLGTRGGLLIRKTFPLDGEYLISAKLYRTNNGFTRGLSGKHEVEFSVDGARALLTYVGGEEDWAALLANPSSADRVDARLQTRVAIKAGRREVGVTFFEKTGARGETLLRPLLGPADSVDSDGVPRIDTVQITGPFNPTGSGDTPSRKRVFSCRPAAATAAAESRCASTIVASIARRGFRRPASAADIAELMTFYERGRRERGTFEGGVQMALRRILADPRFLFRVERDPANVSVATAYRVSDLELASRLSFFLWSSIPDEPLLAAAADGRLRTPAVFAREVTRMLADPKSDALVDNFAGQWLQLRNLQRVTPDPMEFPDFDDNLRQAFRRETELLFAAIVRDDRPVAELVTADYTFVNERLAKHYGVPGIHGTAFRRVPVAADERRGLLGHGSVLTLTSYPNRTSPVKRGKWILETLLGSPPPPPPPNVPPLEEKTAAAKPRTMRERMEEHRANPACANCHRLMDPIGLALENFDGVGTWRVREAGTTIDASSLLADGTAIDGVVALRAHLVQRSALVARTFTENLMTYALGRGLTADDMPAVRAILRQTAPQQYRAGAIIRAIASSPEFQMRMSVETDQ